MLIVLRIYPTLKNESFALVLKRSRASQFYFYFFPVQNQNHIRTVQRVPVLMSALYAPWPVGLVLNGSVQCIFL